LKVAISCPCFIGPPFLTTTSIGIAGNSTSKAICATAAFYAFATAPTVYFFYSSTVYFFYSSIQIPSPAKFPPFKDFYNLVVLDISTTPSSGSHPRLVFQCLAAGALFSGLTAKGGEKERLREADGQEREEEEAVGYRRGQSRSKNERWIGREGEEGMFLP